MSVNHWMSNILIFIELICFLTGILYWKKLANTIWQWFVVYLGFIASVEWICNYLSYYTIHKNVVNSIFTFIVVPLEFIFLYWLYYKHANGSKNKLLVIVCTIVYIASFIADQYFFQDKKFIFDSVSYCLGNLLLLLIIISFFIQFSRSDEILQYSSSLIFWVSLGVIIFYLGTLPYFGLRNLLIDKYRSVFNNYTYLMYAFNWLMYLLFIIGFIKWKPK